MSGALAFGCPVRPSFWVIIGIKDENNSRFRDVFADESE
jgi:hypothetical protein